MDIEGETVVVFSIGEFPIKPVAFKIRYFRRVANRNHLSLITETTNLHLQSRQLSWDSHENPYAELEDLDETKIKTFIHNVNGGGRFQLDGKFQMPSCAS